MHTNDGPGTVTALASCRSWNIQASPASVLWDSLFTVPRILVSAPHLLLHS